MARQFSIDIIQRYLEPRGYVFQAMKLGVPQREYVHITSPTNVSMVIPLRKLSPPFISSSAQGLFVNKSSMYDFAQLFGINIPATITLTHAEGDLAQASEFMKKVGTVIVKPHNSYGSNGLALNVATHAQLERAVTGAFEFSQALLIQEQFYGEEIRFLTVDGIVCAALLRRKAHVTGDGTSTVAQLVDDENNSRKQITDTLIKYPELTEVHVGADLLHSKYIPAKGENVELNKSTMIGGGASVYSVLHEIHPDYVANVEKIASQFGTGYLAIDFMFHDHTTAATSDNYVFLEVNTNPVLSMFYSCRDGNHVPIVEKYIGPLFERALR